MQDPVSLSMNGARNTAVSGARSTELAMFNIFLPLLTLIIVISGNHSHHLEVS